jgi:2-keto-4-pentenoate hydratase/2-oxohepta-3-ene-1,7-dioic acid hydratase in catechol pathway
MRIVRYQINDEAPKYGWMLEDKIGEIQGDLYGQYRRRDAKTPLADVKLVPPCEPTKILCIGRNYVEHAKELGNEVPKVPLIFMKPPSAIIANGESIILPPQSKQVEHEAELVIVIGKRGRSMDACQRLRYLLFLRPVD